MQRMLLPLLVALVLSGSVRCEVEEDPDADVTVETEEEPIEEVAYASPSLPRDAHFAEHFDDPAAFERRWVRSRAKKDDTDEEIAKYDGEWAIESLEKHALQGDRGLVLKTRAKHAAISSRLTKPFHFLTKPLVVQYEVNLQKGQECGGAYLKLLTDAPDLEPANFRDKTPYTIMFGPDKCGNDNKLHFIMRHRNPVTGDYEEKHAKRATGQIEAAFNDKTTHLYRLVVRPDNSFEMFVDDKVVNSGSLLEDMTPAVNPPQEIDDSDDIKPADWDDKEKIVDADATKPDDWDEEAPAKITDEAAQRPDGWLEDTPEMVADAEAEQPADWDVEMDGEWEAPLVANPACADAAGCGPWTAPTIDNPAYRGKWRPPMVDNPAYRGKWAPRRIANPHYFEDLQPFKMASIGAVGMELWSMSDGIYFDNVLITDSLVDAQQFMEETFALKDRQRSSREAGAMERLIKYSNARPWLYAVYVIAVGLPLVLVIFFCCFSGAKKDDVASRKKTDEPQEDDVPAEGEDVAAGGEDVLAEEGPAETEDASAEAEDEPAERKSAEDKPAGEAAEESAEKEEDEKRQQEAAAGDAAEGEHQEQDQADKDSEEEAPAPGGEGDAPRSSPRRRRPRRD